MYRKYGSTILQEQKLIKGECLLRERNEVKFVFIRDESTYYPVVILCRVMKVSKSAFYDWNNRPGKLISADTLRLYRRMKALFERSRDSLGSREMMKKLREEGFKIDRYLDQYSLYRNLYRI